MRRARKPEPQDRYASFSISRSKKPVMISLQEIRSLVPSYIRRKVSWGSMSEALNAKGWFLSGKVGSGDKLLAPLYSKLIALVSSKRRLSGVELELNWTSQNSGFWNRLVIARRGGKRWRPRVSSIGCRKSVTDPNLPIRSESEYDSRRVARDGPGAPIRTSSEYDLRKICRKIG